MGIGRLLRSRTCGPAHRLRWQAEAVWVPATERVPNKGAGRDCDYWRPSLSCPNHSLALSLVRVGEAFGHDGRSRGDDQGNSEHDLLHVESPLRWPIDLSSIGWPSFAARMRDNWILCARFPNSAWL